MNTGWRPDGEQWGKTKAIITETIDKNYPPGSYGIYDALIEAGASAMLEALGKMELTQKVKPPEVEAMLRVLTKRAKTASESDKYSEIRYVDFVGTLVFIPDKGGE